MLGKVLKAVAWIVGALLFMFFSLAIVYKDDPIVQLSVRQIFIGVASWVSDTKALKDAIKHDIQKELKK